MRIWRRNPSKAVKTIPGLLLAFPALLYAQEVPLFRAQTSLAQVRFHVTQKDRYLIDLKAADVILLEDGMPRPITVFHNAIAGGESSAVEITLLFDTSGSVTDEGLLSPLAFKASLLDSLGNAQIGVYGFGRNLRRYTAPTREYPQLAAAFASLREPEARGEAIPLALPPKSKAETRGGTWLYEAVAAVTRIAAATPGDGARLILVFSDGFPSTNTRPEYTAAVARECGIPIYPVVLGHRALSERMNAMLERQKPNQPEPAGMMGLRAQEQEIMDFASLAELTGGRSFDPPMISLSMLRQVLGNMVAQVRTEYTVGFTAEVDAVPRAHKLEVRLRNRDLGRVRGGTRTVRH